MTQEEKNYEALPQKIKTKMKKYYRQQLKKHPDVPIANIQEKLAKKFNVKLVQ